MKSLENVPRMMDITDDDDFFTHNIRDIYTANFFFEIKAQNKRGKKESLLLSVVFKVQNENDEWIKQITTFLQGQKEALNEMANTLKNDPKLSDAGMFNPNNVDHLKRLLYGFYTSIFVNNARDLLSEKVVNQRIWVLSPPRYNAIETLEKIKKIVSANTGLLQTEIMHLILSRMNFTLFNCEYRQQDLKNCSVCYRQYIESTACLFVFNVDDGEARGDIEDVVTHVYNLDSKHKKQCLFLGISEHDYLDEYIKKFDDVFNNIKKKTLNMNIRRAYINIHDFKTYSSTNKWFLSVLFP